MELQKLLRKKNRALDEGNLETVANMCKQLGEVYSRLGRYEEALREYKEEEHVWEVLQRPLDIAVANRMIGEVYSNMGEFIKALYHQKKHLEIAKQQQSMIEEQRALATIGRTYFCLAESLDTSDDEYVSSLIDAKKAYIKSLSISERLTGLSKQEQVEMKARLLLNIGLVLECQQDLDSCIEYLEKATKLCKSHDLYEDLFRCYISVGLVYFRQNNTSRALSFLNQAHEVAKRLNDKALHSCEALAAKAEVLFSLSDFRGAKQALLKAYKLKTPNEVERESIESNLKIAVAMCQAEEKLLTVNSTDFTTRKQLYETLGDGCVAVKNFSKAIEYYHKMLECIEILGDDSKSLVCAFVSLAQTYKDNKQYEKSLEYFKKELEVHGDNPAEACKTMLNIAEIAYCQDKTYSDLETIYMDAKNLALLSGQPKLEIMVLKSLLCTQQIKGEKDKACGTERELQSKIEEVGGTLDSEEEASCSEETPNIGSDICLELLSDDSVSESEDFDRPRETRKRTQLRVKRNEKGETQLHTACIAGKVKVVKTLLEQGHPLNVRDNCGWSPLHEACNHGYKEIVEMLLDKGASINDRGGAECGGVTPLHDAASCGNLDVVELLLDRGASAVARTDDGETPLDCLRQWRERARVEIDPVTQSFYEAIENRLQSALNRVCQQTVHTPAIININQSSLSKMRSNIPDQSHKQKLCRTEKQKNYKNKSSDYNSQDRQNLRKNIIDIDSSESDSEEKNPHNQWNPASPSNNYNEECNSSMSPLPKTKSLSSNSRQLKRNSSGILKTGDVNHLHQDKSDININSMLAEKYESIDESNAKDEYIKAINAVRKKQVNNKKVFSSNETKQSLSHRAFLTEDDVGDDWLEDDTCAQERPHKRKKQNLNQRSSDSTTGERIRCRGEDDEDSGKELILEDDSIEDVTEEQVEDYDEWSRDSTSSANNTGRIDSWRRPVQRSLFETGFTRERKHSNTAAQPASAAETEGHLQPRAPVRSAPSAIKVHVDDMLFMIPVQDSANNTIGWLCEETIQRCFEKKGEMPYLDLKTKDGAILSNNDPVSLITAEEELYSNVSGWTVPPVAERYKKACKRLQTGEDSFITNCLENCQQSKILNLSSLSLNGKQLTPIFQSLRHQRSLSELHLDGNTMENSTMKMLIDCMKTLPNLQLLNLSSNNITPASLEDLSAAVMSDGCSPILQDLKTLHLDYNPIGDSGIKHVCTLSRGLSKLRCLKLRNCYITRKCNTQSWYFCLDGIESLDISHNLVGVEGVGKFLAGMNADRIVRLDVSHTIPSATENGCKESVAGLICLFFEQATVMNITHLELAACAVKDTDVYQLVRILEKGKDLQYLGLSGNPNLTSLSLQELLRCEPALRIDISNCPDIIVPTDTVFSQLSISKIHTLIISILENKFSSEDQMVEFVQKFVDLWSDKWAEDASFGVHDNNTFHFFSANT